MSSEKFPTRRNESTEKCKVLAEEIERFQETEHNEGAIATARRIARFLRAGDFESARLTAMWESDKMILDEEISGWMKKNLIEAEN